MSVIDTDYYIKGGIPKQCVVSLSTRSDEQADALVYNSLFDSTQRVGVIVLSNRPLDYVGKLFSIHVKNAPEGLNYKDVVEVYNSNYGQEKEIELCKLPDGSTRFYVADNPRESIDDLKSTIMSLVTVRGRNVIFLDNIQEFLTGSSYGEECDFMVWLRRETREYDFSVVLLFNKESE